MSGGYVCVCDCMCKDRCFSSVNELDAVGSLLEAMDLHLKNTKIIKNACMTLAALVEPNGNKVICIISFQPNYSGTLNYEHN